MANLQELDSLSIQVIIDNELDPISPSPSTLVGQSGGMRTIAMNGPTPQNRAAAAKELRMDHICCSAHGLSLLITGVKNGVEHTVLFDTGPEEEAFERNAKRLGADLGKVEVVQLSHWHRDHSGGMLKAVEMVNATKGQGKKPVVVDLHPARPMFRGNQPPETPVVSMEADPSFSEIEAAGGRVSKSSEPHEICDAFFTVSGEIPRVTEYEKGLRFGMRLDTLEEGWKKDEEMWDERFLMCRLKGKGIVLFTGCSHAGVVNACRHGVELANPTNSSSTSESSSPALARASIPLYAVMGGFHLADASPDLISSSVSDLKALDPKILLAGHCTGWRAKFEIEKTMPGGRLVPSFVGGRYDL